MSRVPDRKLRFAYFSAALITLGFVATGFLPVLQSMYGLFVGAVGGIAALLLGANVVQKIGTQGAFIKELEIAQQEKVDSNVRIDVARDKVDAVVAKDKVDAVVAQDKKDAVIAQDKRDSIIISIGDK